MEELKIGIDTLWVLLAGFLVFFMQAGFGMVEAGFIRAKNATNILMKNFVDFCSASLAFFIIGYALMFGEGNGFMGLSGFFMNNAANPSEVPLFAFLFFQTAFAGAAATIVAGAMAGRMKFIAYLLYTMVVTAFVYPIVGHWIWGGGWLSNLGFADFAGSTVVHLVGGSIAFIGAYLLGPREGKFNKDGSANMIPGHNIPMAALGVFLLWFGWFGFNPGSTLSIGDGKLVSLVAINTNLSAVTAGLSAMLVVWKKFGKPDLSMTGNGILAGLVAITAPCAYVSPITAIIIGAVSGFVVVYGVILIDKCKVDDPVGAVAVHGLNGIWGTLSIGLFGQESLGLISNGLFLGGGLKLLFIQLLGVSATLIFCMSVMGLVFYIIKATIGLRVSRTEELKGLDIGEHGMEAYAGFQIFVAE